MLRLFRHLQEFWRLYFVEVVFFVLSFVLINHLYGISIEKNQFYTARARSQYDAQKEIKPRGKISFSSRNLVVPAAINEKIPFIFISPADVKPEAQDEFVQKAKPLFSLSEAEWNEILEDKRSQYHEIELEPTPEMVRRAKELKLKGLYVGEKLRRIYPKKDFAGGVLGFVTDPLNYPVGQYGVEQAFQDKLGDPAFPADIVLTLDYYIQQEGERVLDTLMKDWKAESATLIVQDPSTGAILAMAQKPGFDPNLYNEFSYEKFLNQSVASVYEPGSVFKALTFASALDAGRITPKTTYEDTGSLSLDGYTIKNWDKKAHGLVTMVEVLENSLNTGAAFIERKLGHDLFFKYVKDFGFGGKTGIELPGEVSGNVNNLKGFREVHFATASFGQGISVTPLQLISAMSAIANNGKLMKPYVVDRFEYPDGSVERISPKVVRKVLDDETARKTIDALVSVVDHGRVGAVPGYHVGGKTGTAQIPSSNGKYDEDAYIHSFVGFAPAEKPKFIVLIKLTRPVGAPLSGMTVVPAFREFTKFLLDYYQIPPNKVKN